MALRNDIDPDVAVMFNPLGAGVRWAVQLPNLQLGESTLILGPGIWVNSRLAPTMRSTVLPAASFLMRKSVVVFIWQWEQAIRKPAVIINPLSIGI